MGADISLSFHKPKKAKTQFGAEYKFLIKYRKVGSVDEVIPEGKLDA
jgi:hypothetical protein